MRQQRAHEKQPDLFHPKQADTQLRPEECSELPQPSPHLGGAIKIGRR